MHLLERKAHYTEEIHATSVCPLQLETSERATEKIFKTKQGKLKLVTPTFYGITVLICEKLRPIKNENG